MSCLPYPRAARPARHASWQTQALPRILRKGAISVGLGHMAVCPAAATSDSGLDFDWLDKRSLDPVRDQHNPRTTRTIGIERFGAPTRLPSKRSDAPYRGSRSSDGLKLKRRRRQTFVIAGCTLRSDDPQAVVSVLLPVHGDQGRLLPAGSVRTCRTRDAERQLLQQLPPWRCKTLPLDAPPPAPARRALGSAADGALQCAAQMYVLEFHPRTLAAR